MQKGPKVIDWAMQRLREEAELRTIRDGNGRVTLIGYPEPGTVRDQLRRVYAAGVKAGKRRANA